MFKRTLFIFLAISLTFIACKKETEDDNNNTNNNNQGETDDGPKLVFKVKLNPNQERLNNVGEPTGVPQGHGAQTPDFNGISAHYIELAPTAYTQVGEGEVLYHAPETTSGGDNAIDFDQATIVNDGEVMYSISLKDVDPGTYQYARVSLGYQNYDVDFRAEGYDFKATLASFVGYNNYITSFKVKDETVTVNANKLQGYWAWETHPNQVLTEAMVETGQAPGTTVPNPLSDTSPIPAGSCLVTGGFTNELTITGDETEDIVVELSLSINNSFEWEDANENNIFEPLDGDEVVDMGIRGLIATRIE